jgi:hypothetical protein
MRGRQPGAAREERTCVRYPGPVPATAEEIVTFCRLHLGEGEAERLVGWIAWRTGRNQALAGAGAPIDRLRHASEHWLDDERRARLLTWLRRRIAEGRPPVPG